MNEVDSIISFWQTSGQAHNTLWTFFIVVTSAVVGFTFSETYHKLPKYAQLSLFIILFFFLLSNFVSILNNLKIYNASIEQLKALKIPTSPHLLKVIKATSEMPGWRVLGLRGILDFCILIIVGKASLTKTSSRGSA